MMKYSSGIVVSMLLLLLQPWRAKPGDEAGSVHVLKVERQQRPSMAKFGR